MTRIAERHGAINLAQGFPDFPAPEALKEAACRAIRDDHNQYAVTWGAHPLREALAAKYRAFNGMAVDPETMVTVTCGSTEAMIAALLATLNPGDEVVVFEPYYENYGPDTILCGAVPRFVRLREPDWSFDERELESAVGPRTRGIIINTPNNPTGKVFTRAELETIARLCLRHDLLAFTDEVYEHIVYDGARHLSLAAFEGMADRTLTISALSKSFSVTGWRLGYVIAPAALTGAVRKVHDFLTVGAPHPLQLAAAHLLQTGGPLLERLAAEYQERREIFFEGLEAAGLAPPRKPEGAYYVMVDIARFGHPDDTAFAHWLTKEIGVAPVPGSSFFMNPRDGHGIVRFAFCKKPETLREATRRLKSVVGSP